MGLCRTLVRKVNIAWLLLGDCKSSTRFLLKTERQRIQKVKHL